MSGTFQVRIRSLPLEAVDERHFELASLAADAARDEVMVRAQGLSFQPYMRMRMANAVAGRVPQAPGDLMMGRTVGEVVVSSSALFRRGDIVLGWGGWQQYAAQPVARMAKVARAEGHSVMVHLGVLVRLGITGWLCVVRVLSMEAAGAVGGLAGQMARHLGARVTRIAGCRAKCVSVVSQLGFSACVDYGSGGFDQALCDATPLGVDACFENVGAAVLDATLARAHKFKASAWAARLTQGHGCLPDGAVANSAIEGQERSLTGPESRAERGPAAGLKLRLSTSRSSTTRRNSTAGVPCCPRGPSHLGLH